VGKQRSYTQRQLWRWYTTIDLPISTSSLLWSQLLLLSSSQSNPPHHQEKWREAWNWGVNKKRRRWPTNLWGGRHTSHERGSSSNSIPLLCSPSFGILLFFFDAWERQQLNRWRGLGFVGSDEKIFSGTMRRYSNRAPVHIGFFFQSSNDHSWLSWTPNNAYEQWNRKHPTSSIHLWYFIIHPSYI
jgi:hypothetical protein